MLPPGVHSPQNDDRPASASALGRSRVSRQDLAGVVLCGGRSARMGRDKAQLEINGQSLLARALSILDEVSDDVRIACGPSARYEECGRDLVLDRASDLGPLGGLAAALASTPAEHIVALACDMPRIDARIVRVLVDTARSRDLDACVLRSERGIEPLCGVWKKSMLHPIETALQKGERRVVAPFEEQLADGTRPNVGFVDVEDAEVVHNVNTPADVEITLRTLTLPLLPEAVIHPRGTNPPPRTERAR